MTIDINPQQEQAIRAAIRDGQVGSFEEFIDHALAALPRHGDSPFVPAEPTVFEQGLGLFGSQEDSAILDEVVSIAYAERHRPTKRGPASE